MICIRCSSLAPILNNFALSIINLCIQFDDPFIREISYLAHEYNKLNFDPWFLFFNSIHHCLRIKSLKNFQVQHGDWKENGSFHVKFYKGKKIVFWAYITRGIFLWSVIMFINHFCFGFLMVFRLVNHKSEKLGQMYRFPLIIFRLGNLKT